MGTVSLHGHISSAPVPRAASTSASSSWSGGRFRPLRARLRSSTAPSTVRTTGLSRRPPGRSPPRALHSALQLPRRRALGADSPGSCPVRPRRARRPRRRRAAVPVFGFRHGAGGAPARLAVAAPWAPVNVLKILECFAPPPSSLFECRFDSAVERLQGLLGPLGAACGVVGRGTGQLGGVLDGAGESLAALSAASSSPGVWATRSASRTTMRQSSRQR